MLDFLLEKQELKVQLSVTEKQALIRAYMQALVENRVAITSEDPAVIEAQPILEEVPDEPYSNEEQPAHGTIGATSSREEPGGDYMMSGPYKDARRVMEKAKDLKRKSSLLINL